MIDLDRYRPHMLPKVRSDLIMASAAGKPCTARIASFIPGRCCAGRDTTVGAHAPVTGKGMSTKVTDIAVLFTCGPCHDIIDGRDPAAWKHLIENYPAAVLDRILNGLVETHALLIDQGVIIIPDASFV
jgi:hypothetical protein